MADRELVLCEPLCFMLNRNGKSKLKSLKRVIIDFCSPEVISAAENRLLDDAGNLMLTDKMPHFPRRRDREGRSVREVDDIVAIVSTLDEQNVLNKLPRYVAESPDNMLSIRLTDGDMKILLVWLEKLGDKIDNYGTSMNDMVTQIRTLQPRPGLEQDVRSTTAQSVQSTVPASLRHVAMHNAANQSAVTGNSIVAVKPASNENGVSKYSSWSLSASTSMSNSMQQSTTLLSTATDTGSQGESTDEQRLYSEVVSRKKRLRTRSNLQQQQQHQQQQHDHQAPAALSSRAAPIAGAKPHTGGTRIIGKLSNNNFSMSSPAQKFVAAKPLIKKAVFCVDNVDSPVSTEDIRAFVTEMSVNVVSCFEAKETSV